MQNLALGIDIGGTNTSFGLVNRRGEIIAKHKTRTTGHATLAAYISHLKEQIDLMMAPLQQHDIIGVGVGAPNANFYTGEIANAVNLPWNGVIPLARLLTDALGLKTTITNDANAAAIGEMTYGVAKGMKDFIMVTLGTGLGSGFVANGKLIYGHDGFAGELGHVIAIRGGRACNCGRFGCLETYVSATGIVRTAQEWLGNRSDKTVLRPYGNALTAFNIQEAAAAGDAMAVALYEFTGNILGYVLADMAAITSPEAIVFFGGLAHAGRMILEPTQRSMEDNLLSFYKNKIALLQSSLQDADAAILGASALAW